MKDYFKNFLDECELQDFADNELLPMPRRETTPVEKCYKNINVNDIVGSTGRQGYTWLELIRNYKYKDRYNSIDKAAESAYNVLANEDYNVYQVGDSNKLYMGEGHNRLSLLKFYINIYNKSPVIKVRLVHYAEAIDDEYTEEDSIFNKIHHFFNRQFS